MDQTEVENATPLDPDESAGLIPSHLMTQKDLNEWEQMNILAARQEFLGKKILLDQFCTVSFMLKLHKHMFNRTWRWAGKFRTTEKNIGVDPRHIGPQLQVLLGDLYYWVTNDSYESNEAAYRFHHRLVLIHPFPNGNGRHARFATDILRSIQNKQEFSWGSIQYPSTSEVRKAYINALRKADKGDFEELSEFVRS